ncbi:iron uptake porin [Cyanobium sp. NIES-981]|uniref:iron uptake porin n=1 Tax=Cyanobium sp. NIES-981 TaxID=1851505 RepID=UPI0007DD9BF2|nr:iron uptake porin [Cyanobium sp. NIES-981]SBO42771.1 putative porin [Cyanobium sp. NIES-981]
MKFFQRLLVAPAALGLLAPVAANASEVRAELNLDGVNQYASQEQVTSISQFSDVQPTSWAYQALSNLIERYGCVAGYPDGTYRGQKAMTRFEAAALLNACLDRVTEVTDELKRLMAEFEKELAVLKGRVDGLEAKVGELEATQFSTTTKLKGEVSMILGGMPDFDNVDGADPDQTTFNYDVRLNFDTSFSGKDLLRTRLRAGNFSSLPFGSSSQIFTLDKATGTDDSVKIDRLFYDFPVGESFNLTVGALVRNTEMIAFLPSAYKSSILDYFGLAGASGTYNKATGAGAGFRWKQNVEKGRPYATFSANYVSSSGFADSSIGAFSEDSGINALAQLGVKAPNWGAAVAYRYGSEASRIRNPNFSGTVLSGEDTNSVAVGAYWQPSDSGWIPSISLGYGYNDGSGGFPDSQSWMVGFQWDDAFAKGNAAGFAFGMPPFVDGDEGDEAWLYEIFYKFQVTDNISITPALFYGTNAASNGGDDAWGGVIQTTFKF